MKDKQNIKLEEKVEELEVLSDEQINEEINSLIDVSDEEIQNSLKLAEIEECHAGRKKHATTVQADKLITKFLSTRSDESWKDLQEFFWYGIKQFAFKYVQNNDDAYDMTIETFINAFNNISSYDPNKAKFSTWLWTICRNNCLAFIKRNQRINIVDNDLSDIYDSLLVGNSYIQNVSEFENGKFNGSEFESSNFSEVYKELYDVSLKEMNRLPGIGKKILHMKLVEDKKIREIAVELSMNESTVKNYLYRGKENLKRILSINHKELVDTYKDMNEALDFALYF